MAGYSPLKITGNSTGLVQNREEFLLPDDAYPNLENAYVWRERILRKKGCQLLGRLQREETGNLGNTDGSGNLSGNIFSILTLGSLSSLVPGSFVATVGANTYTEPSPPDGSLLVNGVPSPVGNFINWATGDFGLVTGLPATPVAATFNYYTNLPVMGIRTRELKNSTNDQTVFFDQKYAYIFNNGVMAFEEFIPGTTWNAHNGGVASTDFFWSTNYWVSSTPIFSTSNQKLFWVTNNTGQFGALADPPRITDGTTWVDFYSDASPVVDSPWAQIDATNWLVNWLSMLPFRGRMVTFNTWEGLNATSAQNFSNRIRWSTIGNPFIAYSNGPPATGSWRDDIRGQGGFLDIPTSEDIISIGFVRDNLVIYCERSTWQLRYTGRSIAPFQIERVNSEIGGEGPFSAVQFDTSLVGIGDKGIVECDSYKSERIDIKIPDFVFAFRNSNNGPFRVHGIRDFINRLAFWTIPLANGYDPRVDPGSWIFPNRRLVYNYENDSWALFTDSLTVLGTYQPQSSRNWVNTQVPWVSCNFSWINSQPAEIPSILGGNQQGFVHYLDELTVNDPSLYISNVTPNTTTATVITVPNHNLISTAGYNVPYIIQVSGIAEGTPYDNLNGGIFGVSVVDVNNLALYIYDSETRQFSSGQIDINQGDYVGGGLINLRDNFSVISKKFNFLDEGQSIQLGYLDVLMNATEPEDPGAISLNVYLDYNDFDVSNTLPQNEIKDYSLSSDPDTFFNSIIPTTSSNLNTKGGSKFWQRVFCSTRANFLTLEYTLSNAQLAGEEQTKDVQIDAQVLWIRKAGRMTQF